MIGTTIEGQNGARAEQAFTSSEVMRILQISKRTFFTYVKEEPMFRTYLQGNKRYMDPSDLAAWREYRKARS